MARYRTDVEQCAGRRADFYIHYTRHGKKYFDAMWAPDEVTARERLIAMAAEIGWTVEITRVEAAR